MADFPYSKDQADAMAGIDTFLIRDYPGSRYIISGFAGTGKTTLIRDIYKRAIQLNRNQTVMILAMTHRALQVIRDKFPGLPKRFYSTVHSALYGAPKKKEDAEDVETEDGRLVEIEKEDQLDFAIGSPKPLNLIGDFFIVDESSMIPQDILKDIEDALGSKKILYIGDSYQLPPIGKDQDHDLLLHPDSWLTQVVRHDSNLLTYVSAIREQQRVVVPSQSVQDITLVNGDLVRCYLDNRTTVDDIVLITGLNQERTYFNGRIRMELFPTQDPLVENESIISISNNVVFSNGQVFQIKKIHEYEGRDVVTIRGKFGPVDEIYHIYKVEDFNGRTFEMFLFPQTRRPSIYNSQIPCLRVNEGVDTSVIMATYGYAMTCHKAQGGQWPKVIVNQSTFKDEPRWLYTAATRAQETLFLNASNYNASERIDFNSLLREPIAI